MFESPDGTPVYKTVEEANAAVVAGYHKALGVPMANVAQPISTNPVAAAPVEGFAFCKKCGTRYEIGKAKFCSSCGAELENE